MTITPLLCCRGSAFSRLEQTEASVEGKTRRRFSGESRGVLSRRATLLTTARSLPQAGEEKQAPSLLGKTFR